MWGLGAGGSCHRLIPPVSSGLSSIEEKATHICHINHTDAQRSRSENLACAKGHGFGLSRFGFECLGGLGGLQDLGKSCGRNVGSATGDLQGSRAWDLKACEGFGLHQVQGKQAFRQKPCTSVVAICICPTMDILLMDSAPFRNANPRSTDKSACSASTPVADGR